MRFPGSQNRDLVCTAPGGCGGLGVELVQTAKAMRSSWGVAAMAVAAVLCLAMQAPVGVAQVGTASDYEDAQVLIADERQIRTVHDGTGLARSLAVVSVA